MGDVIALSYVWEEAAIPFQLPLTIHIDKTKQRFRIVRPDAKPSRDFKFAGCTKLRHINARAACQCWVEALRLGDAQLVAPRYAHTTILRRKLKILLGLGLTGPEDWESGQ